MSQNGQTHFKNLANAVSDHFRTLCVKGLNKCQQENATSLTFLFNLQNFLFLKNFIFKNFYFIEIQMW